MLLPFKKKVKGYTILSQIHITNGCFGSIMQLNIYQPGGLGKEGCKRVIIKRTLVSNYPTHYLLQV